jgi:hypothetical protein
MGSHTPPQGEAAGFEAAVDILDQLIGYASKKIDEERAKHAPDSDRVHHWTSQRDAWAATRRELDPRDSDAVRAVLDRDGATLQALVGGIGR